MSHSHDKTPLLGSILQKYRAKVVKSFELCKFFLHYFTFFGIFSTK